MKKNTNTLALIISSLAIITETKLRQGEVSSSDSIEDYGSLEDRNWLDSYRGPVQLDLKGTLKRTLILHAALADPSRSLICSPMSALLPLGKLVLGTERGKSRDELLSAIGLSTNKVKKRMRSMITKLRYLPGVTLTIASTIYVSDKKNLLEKYNSDTLSVFKTTCQKLDFTRPAEAAAAINKKVMDSTNGKITKIITPGDISPSTSVILVNAIYFAGKWQDPFEQIFVGEFFTPFGATKVPMMTRHGEYKYAKSDALGAQLIEIPYEGGKASFVIVLPKTQNGLSLLLKQLKVAPEMLNRALSSMRELTVFLTMPKFRIESELNLNVLYEKIGVKRIFLNDQSGLSRMVRGSDKLWVSKAVQKAYIEVTEKGTEAAGATAAQMVAMSAQLDKIVFRADRSFLFFIKTDGEQLFAGIYTGV